MNLTSLQRGEHLALVDDAGASRPVLMHSKPVPLAEGWRVTMVYAPGNDFVLLDLKHRQGAESFWLLDSDLEVKANHLDVQNAETGLPILGVVSCHINAFGRALLALSPQAIGRDVHHFYRLSVSTRETLARAAARQPAGIVLTDLVGAKDAEPWRVISGLPALSHHRLMSALHVHLDQAFQDALRTGRLRWPLLFADGMAEIVHCIFLDYSAGYLRVFDHSANVTFYVAFEGADLMPSALLVPDAGVSFGWSTGPQNIAFSRMSAGPDFLLYSLQTKLLSAPEGLADWLGTAPKTNGHFMWPSGAAHLSHYIWNELTGLEKILQPGAEANPKVWDLAGPEYSNFFGAIEDLYPELKGCVSRDVVSLDGLFAHSIRTATQAVRVSGDVVTGGIRSRILATIDDNADLQTARKAAAFLPPGVPVLLLGLRLGTRALVDCVEAYESIIKAILARTGQIAVIIDGLNAVPGRPQGATFQVYKDGHASMGPIEQEHAIAARLVQICNDLGLPVVNCVGTTMITNLWWMRNATFFVAPWGGGFAKYRWVLNLPGYALTSAHNLREPFILSIYHAARFMEGGSPLYYPDPSWVEDVDNSASPGRQSDASFSIHPDLIEDVAERFVRHVHGSNLISPVEAKAYSA